jgi:diguanylate cyclase (GGDEF)-like protein
MNAHPRPKRILVADDDPHVLDAYRRVLEALLAGAEAPRSGLDDLSAELFGDTMAPPAAHASAPLQDVTYCRQGETAVHEVRAALENGQPFAVVFLDMRMPPGIDGLETARRIRAIDQDVNIVVVTGYSDHRPSAIADAIGVPGKIFYLSKPFDADELQQMASALAERWSGDREIASELKLRIEELERLNWELKESEARAQRAAGLDMLTGLSNRAGLSRRFEEAAGPAEPPPPSLSMLYLDLDRFKDVNDSLGHLVGDELIRAFAQRLMQATGEDGFAARLGGDEFAVICTDRSLVHQLADRLIQTCSQPYVLNGHRVRVGVSIGIAHSEGQLIEAMRRADIALYAAKSAGRGVWREFDPSMERDIIGDQRIASDLVEAIAENKLALHYQPVVCADGSRICSVEALLRWEHPTRGMIPPLVFIGVAEKTGLMHELGEWVIRRAFKDSRRWPDLVTAINLSPTQLQAPGLVDWIGALASDMGVEPPRIEFEITETTLIADVEGAAEQLRRLMAMGFGVALDDFGSGYASLAYLTRIPFSKLKIDRSLVSDLQLRSGADQVVRAIVGLGQALGLPITAEGVEYAEQHHVLAAAGCSFMQGFLFHRPLPVEELMQLRSRVAAGAAKVA